ncbi:Gfo/Idh/MocA family oxidoreductase [candidate division KSB1 bacterium]|nr:Gfo/Idh/MocA family oxidoreductase [candidate division KSB1 bacterium]
MQDINRRSFISKSTAASAGVIVGLPIVTKSYAKSSPNDTINIAMIGTRIRWQKLFPALANVPNVRIVTLCDIDQRLLPEAVSAVEALTGHKPKTETEYRKVLEDKHIDAVVISTPNHWHALQTIWACQAGKDVYVEKPVSHTIVEGRKMVEAARKYNRVVQAGTQSRSSTGMIDAIKFLHEGRLGELYMVKGLCLKPRASIGHTIDSEIPIGVNWDTFLGPAPYRPFNENRFHYKWHWFWDTGNGDLGNQGPHQTDIARWALNIRTHPIKISGVGKIYVWDSDQETPNTQHIEFEYEDGRIIQFEVRGMASNPEAGIRIGNIYFGHKGWMGTNHTDGRTSQVHYTDIKLQPNGFSSYKEEIGPIFSDKPRDVVDYVKPEVEEALILHFQNFIDCVRSRKWQDLNGEILDGHLSSSLCHLGNIACRLNRTLEFNPNSEKFVNDEEADSYLTKMYRAPYLLPEKV